MADDTYPAYRASSPPSFVPGVPLVAVLGGLAYLGRGGGSATLVATGLGAILIIILSLGFARSRVSATIAGPDGLKIVRLFGTRTTAWTDIQDIKVETRAAWTAQAREPRRTAVLYDREGRGTALPYLDEAHVAALDDEVNALRDLWKRRLGET